jgi:pyrophosphatase PpaX
MQKQMNITTVLFDLDGTLINTNPLIIKTFEVTLAHYFPHQPFTTDEIKAFIGPTLEQTFMHLDPNRVSEMIDYYRSVNKTLHDTMVKPYPTVFEGLSLLKDRGIRLGIVSSKKTDMVIHGLKHFKILDYFEVIIGADEVKNPKPDKEPIELAMSTLGVTKDEVIFVGDNSHDIEGGKNAGVFTCGVAWSLRGANYLKQFGPNYILEDMRDIIKII